MKKIAFFLVAAMIVFAMAIVGVFFWWQTTTSAPGQGEQETRLVIKKGQSAEEIGISLYQAGLIKSVFAFKLYVQSKGLTKSLPTGEFLLPSNLALSDLVDTLLMGPRELWVTIPEGLRKEQVALVVANTLGMEADQRALFLADFLRASEGKEGFLFPDTYLFPRDVTGEAVVSLLLKTFDQRFGVSQKNLIQVSDFSLDEIVILASIIEREAAEDAERPMVAGILVKRLQNNWPLQADATVQYAIGSTRCLVTVDQCDWWPTLIRDDYNFTSGYNTYQNTGLPLDPIANPGLSSLKAALAPETSDYWYYIHDSEGKIHYAETIEEHHQNISRYLQ